MNRRQKIIISVTGIFLVLLILMGLTYAYFLTRINGNPNNTSISLTTANLELTYEDGNEILKAANLLIPGEPVLFNVYEDEQIKLENGEPVVTDVKTFTVTNNGTTDIKEYAVIIDNFSTTYASDMTFEDNSTVSEGESTNFVYPDDLVLTIQCTSSINNESCGESVRPLPTTNDTIYKNSIKQGEIQTYSISLMYNDHGNQSADMNKTFSGRINIMDPNASADIAGEVIDAERGDYAQINSETKTSPIDKDGNFKLVNIEPGNHTLTIRDKSGVIKSTQAISIVKGSTAGVSGTTATISGTNRVVETSIDRKNGVTTISNEVKPYITYSKTGLAYSILANNESGTIENKEIYVANTGELENIDVWESATATCEEVGLNSNSYYDSYIIDKTTGKITVSGQKEVSCSEANTVIDGKYIFDGSSVYYVEDMYCDCEDYSNQVKSFTGRLIKSEKVMANSAFTASEDDFGVSNLFSGDVENNYLNYADMCWRIVRVQGDGKVKLILEDSENECDNGHVLDDLSNSYISNGDIMFYDVDDIYDTLGDWYTTNNIVSEKTDWIYDLSKFSEVYDEGMDDYLIEYSPFGRHNNKTYTLKSSIGLNDSTSRKIYDNIGLLTLDEVALAKGQSNVFYLNIKSGYNFWTMSPYNESPAMPGFIYHYAYSSSAIDNAESFTGENVALVRPSIVIGPDTPFTYKEDTATNGEIGTINNPYVIE